MAKPVAKEESLQPKTFGNIVLDLLSPFLLTCNAAAFTSGDTSTQTCASRNSIGPNIGPDITRGCALAINEMIKIINDIQRERSMVKF